VCPRAVGYGTYSVYMAEGEVIIRNDMDDPA
jgi:hypothetical protein